MTTQKTLILNFIKKHSHEKILDGSYDFNDLNATSIGIDLNIDRTNVSRILNTCHSEDKLIKQKGRPTLFFSREIFMQNYPYLALPKILELGDSIKNYITISDYHLKPQVTENLTFDDLSQDDHLFPHFQKLFPIFFYPFYEMRIILLVGEYGAGKKHLLAKTINQAKKAGVLTDNSAILYYQHLATPNNDLSFMTFLEEHADQTVATLCIELADESQGIFLNYLQKITFFYKNKQINPPVITFSINSSELLSTYLELSPYTVYLDNFAQRTLKNKIYITLQLLQSESIRSDKQIILSKEALLSFLSKDYFDNFHGLKKALFYDVALALANRIEHPSHSTITMTTQDQHSATLAVETRADSLWGKIPENMLLSPNTPVNLTSLLNLVDSEGLQITTTKPELKNLLYAMPTDTTNYQIKENSLDQQIFTLLLETTLKHDAGLAHGLTLLIQKIAHEQFPAEAYNYNLSDFQQDTNRIVYKRILRLLQSFELSTQEQALIRYLIDAATNLVTSIKIPVLIASQSYELDRNFAVYFNILNKKRLFYTLAKDNVFYQQEADISIRIRQLSKSMNSIDRDNGFILVHDFDTKSKQFKHLLLELRTLSFPISYPSLELMQSINDITTRSDKNILSLSPQLIKSRKDKNNHFNTLSLTDSNERLITFTNPMQTIFTHLNTKIITEIFYDILIILANSLTFALTDKLILDFLFMGNCLANNNLDPTKEERRPSSNPPNIEKLDLYNLLQQELLKNPTLKSIDLDSTDIFCLYLIIYNNLYK